MPNPELVVAEARTAFYWRCVSATWWGGLVALMIVVLFRWRPGASEVMTQWARRLLWPVVAIVFAVSVLYP